MEKTAGKSTDSGGFPYWAVIPIVLVIIISVILLAYGVGGSATSQVNVEYWFRLLYECFHGGCSGSLDLTGFRAWASALWVWITIIGYLLSVLAIGYIVYALVRLHQIREEEEHEFGELILAPGSAEKNKRWEHIQALMGGKSPSDWRQAIIEADIMLDEILTRQGYAGESVGEKLKNVEPSDFDTLNDAWEAHKVRNQIAHEGSAFQISDTLARRTIARYEAVFREFVAI